MAEVTAKLPKSNGEVEGEVEYEDEDEDEDEDKDKDEDKEFHDSKRRKLQRKRPAISNNDRKAGILGAKLSKNTLQTGLPANLSSRNEEPGFNTDIYGQTPVYVNPVIINSGQPASPVRLTTRELIKGEKKEPSSDDEADLRFPGGGSRYKVNRYGKTKRRYGKTKRRYGKTKRRYGKTKRRYGKTKRRYGKTKRTRRNK